MSSEKSRIKYYLMTQILFIFLSCFLTVTVSFGQTTTKEILTNKWVVDSVIIDKNIQAVNKEALEKNIKLLKDSAYFDFRADSTVEIKLINPVFIDFGWWTLTDQESFLTVFSSEVPAYYGIPIGEPETIFQIKLLQVGKDKSIFQIKSMTFVVHPIRKN